MTSDLKLKYVPEKSTLTLNGLKLDRVQNVRWLGYILNHTLTDDDHIHRQSIRLNALTNNLKKELPLDLINDDMLRKLAYAYGNTYLLPCVRDTTATNLQVLKKAHRNFVAEITQYYQRSKTTYANKSYYDPVTNTDKPFPYWDPDNGHYERGNRYLYGRLRVCTVDTMLHNQTQKFEKRYVDYIACFDPASSLLIFGSIHKPKSSRIARNC